MLAKSWLNEHNIAFIEKAVERDGVASELIRLGYKSTPVIMINGTAIVGYSPSRLEAAFK